MSSTNDSAAAAAITSMATTTPKKKAAATKRAALTPAKLTKHTPKRQTRPMSAETPLEDRVMQPLFVTAVEAAEASAASAATSAAAAAGTGTDSRGPVMGYVFLTNGDMAELHSRSDKLEHLVENAFMPKLVELRKDNIHATRVDVQYLPLPDRWTLVLDEEGMFQQPFNYGFPSFCGDVAAQMYGRLLLVRTTKAGGSKIEPLPTLPAPLEPTQEDDGEAYEQRLEELYKILEPFRKAYLQGHVEHAKQMAAVKEMGIHIIAM